jgi:hypothetical protein
MAGGHVESYSNPEIMTGQPVFAPPPGNQFVIMSVLFDPPKLHHDGIDVKSFGLDVTMQRLACASWARIPADIKIRIWMDTSEGCKRAADYPEFQVAKCTPVPNISAESGRPFLHSIWLDARAEYPEHVLIWLNSDIIITPEIVFRIDSALSKFPDATIISRRTDFNISKGFSISHDVFGDLNQIMESASAKGSLHDETGIDMFAIRSESAVIDHIPPFVIGAYRWDNWLVFWSLTKSIPVIDITKHGIMLHAVKPSNTAHHASRRGAEYNDLLCKSVVGELFKIGTVSNADYILSQGQSVQVIKRLDQSIAVLLARRASPSRWITVVTVSEGYLDFAYQWLCNIKRIGVRYYIFLAQDSESKKRLMAANEAVVEASDFDLSSDLNRMHLVADSSEEAQYGSVGFQITMTLRTLVLKKILAFGFNVITADLDSIWLQDPLPMFDSVATVQGQEHKKTKMSGGFVAIRSGAVGRDYWQKVCDCQILNMQFLATAKPGTYTPSQYTEQECVNDEAMKLIKKKTPGFAVHILPASYFPDGRSYFMNFDSVRQGILPYVVHNNWVVGMKAKLERLRHSGLYFNGSEFHTCPNHALKPDYTITSVAENEGQVVLNWNQLETHDGYRYRIHILTMCRPKSLMRLLRSMQAADYSGHQVAVVFLVDKPNPDASEEIHSRWTETLNISRSFRLGPGVLHEVVEHTENHGLISQWIDPWPATDKNEIMIILEDDIEVSAMWFTYVTKIAERYYRKDEDSGGDASLAGFSLQRQHTILGERPDLRYGQSTPESILNKDDLLYRYQLPSTWGSVWFPHAWSAFVGWIQDLALNRELGKSLVVKPCVPTLISNLWWKQKPGSIWSVWIVRFVFERGYYFLYTNLPGDSALVINHREAGIHFGGNKGPDSHLVGDIILSSLNDLASIPLYDLHFRRVPTSESLRWNSFVLSPKGLDRCSLFNKSLVVKYPPVFGFDLPPPPPPRRRKTENQQYISQIVGQHFP